MNNATKSWVIGGGVFLLYVGADLGGNSDLPLLVDIVAVIAYLYTLVIGNEPDKRQ